MTTPPRFRVVTVTGWPIGKLASTSSKPISSVHCVLDTHVCHRIVSDHFSGRDAAGRASVVADRLNRDYGEVAA